MIKYYDQPDKFLSGYRSTHKRLSLVGSCGRAQRGICWADTSSKRPTEV